MEFTRMAGVSFYIRNLVGQEMRSRIALARQRGETLAIPETAAEIARSYPGSALAEEDLRNRLFAEAIQAGAPVALKTTTRH
jgi:hypothetical protein